MSETRINLIYARSRNGVIGRDNAMPWYLPEDLAHFKETTSGAPVIMGRKTWDSLPSKFRPLPNRTNIVLTHAEQWQAEGALRVSSIEEALAQITDVPDVWAIGGSQIYELALPYAERAFVTKIQETFEGDAYASELPPEQWQQVRVSEVMTSSTGLKYCFAMYERIAPVPTKGPQESEEESQGQEGQ